MLYYGDILPNTAYLKTTAWAGRYVTGAAYVIVFVLSYAVTMVMVVAGAAVRPRRRPVLALSGVLAVYMAYIAYIGGDAFGDDRFFVPVLPVLFALTGAGY